ncbi:hypothetical protein AAG570_011821 [Ranatra chinensis]|uniref:Succinate dehydrogenase [ubiquinone] cytochrome b small subunit n=1 Tax=Ranatra chinensis TaxID=642074 RepID=A0ABD0YH08_9HEMI
MDHGKLWSYEKMVTLGLLGMMPLHVMFPNILFDVVMSVLMVMHSHWGIEAVVIDYVRPVIFGDTIPKIAIWMVYGFSIVFLVGLFNLIFNSTGLGNSIRMMWSV